MFWENIKESLAKRGETIHVDFKRVVMAGYLASRSNKLHQRHDRGSELCEFRPVVIARFVRVSSSYSQSDNSI